MMLVMVVQRSSSVSSCDVLADEEEHAEERILRSVDGQWTEREDSEG